MRGECSWAAALDARRAAPCPGRHETMDTKPNAFLTARSPMRSSVKVSRAGSNRIHGSSSSGVEVDRIQVSNMHFWSATLGSPIRRADCIVYGRLKSPVRWRVDLLTAAENRAGPRDPVCGTSKQLLARASILKHRHSGCLRGRFPGPCLLRQLYHLGYTRPPMSSHTSPSAFNTVGPPRARIGTMPSRGSFDYRICQGDTKVRAGQASRPNYYCSPFHAHSTSPKKGTRKCSFLR
jgi:hypothetical protein